jgi:hypothetical protein
MVAARTLLHSLVATAVATSLVLVVPTAAVATTVATSITLTVKTSPIPWHGTATLTGRLSKGSAHTALGGRKVTLDGRNAGTTTWHALLTHTTSSTGGFSFSLTNRSVNQNFRVRFAGTSTLRASVSPIRTELVRPPLTNLAQNPAGSTATTGEDRTWTAPAWCRTSGSRTPTKTRPPARPPRTPTTRQTT